MTEKVKKLDDTQAPPLVDHVGLRLWRASQDWQSRFRGRMVAIGHTWFGEARAMLIPYLDRHGTSQAELTARVGLTKQAVQQLIDGLVSDGVVERKPDPADARARLVCFTRKGLAVLADANRVKREIEAEYARVLGPAANAALQDALERLLELPAPGIGRASPATRRKD